MSAPQYFLGDQSDCSVMPLCDHVTHGWAATDRMLPAVLLSTQNAQV
jgi:hypothetical protein